MAPTSSNNSVSSSYAQPTDAIPDHERHLQARDARVGWLLRQARSHPGESGQPIDVSHPSTPPDSPISDDGGMTLTVDSDTTDSSPSSGGARLTESNLTLLQSLPYNADSSANDSEASTIIYPLENSRLRFLSDYFLSGQLTSSLDASNSISSSGSDSWVTFEGSADSGSWAALEGSGGRDDLDSFLRRLWITSQERPPPASLSQLPSLTSGSTASTSSLNPSEIDSFGASVIEYLPQLPSLDSDAGDDEEPWYNSDPLIADSDDSGL